MDLQPGSGGRRNIQNIYNAVLIGVASFFFLYFCFLGYFRVLGRQTDYSIAPLVLGILLGIATGAVGGFFMASMDRKAERFGKVLLAEAIVFTVLSLLLWFAARA